MNGKHNGCRISPVTASALLPRCLTLSLSGLGMRPPALLKDIKMRGEDEPPIRVTTPTITNAIQTNN